MASGKVRWDVETLRSSIHTLTREKDNLKAQRNQMQVQRDRVNVHWKSPAGQQYQNRLGNDMATVDNIIRQLEQRLASLQKVVTRYSGCEDRVAAALKRLPY